MLPEGPIVTPTSEVVLQAKGGPVAASRHYVLLQASERLGRTSDVCVAAFTCSPATHAAGVASRGTGGSVPLTRWSAVQAMVQASTACALTCTTSEIRAGPSCGTAAAESGLSCSAAAPWPGAEQTQSSPPKTSVW